LENDNNPETDRRGTAFPFAYQVRKEGRTVLKGGKPGEAKRGGGGKAATSSRR